MQIQLLKRLILYAFIVALFIHHFFAYIGHFGFDDMEYARLAVRLAEGGFDASNHFSFRLTLVGLTALSYKLFGINDLSSAIPALLITVGTLSLVYRILKDESWPVLTIGLGLFSLNNWTFFYSDKLMPDPFVAFFAFLFFYLVYRYKYFPLKMPVYAYSFLAALALFLGFNSKETIVLLAPLVAWLIVTDIILKRSGKFWLQFVGFCFVLLATYLLVSELAFGNALTRIKAIASNSYLNQCSYDQQPFSVTLERITYGLAKLFLTSDMILGFLVVFAALFVIPIRQILKLNDPKSFFILSSVILILSANFMSISATSYIPMCPDPRHYLFLIPVFAVAAAFILRDHFSQPKFRSLLFLLFLIAFIVALLVKSPVAWKLYLPVSLATGIVLLIKKPFQAESWFAVLLVLALLIQPGGMFIYAKEIAYRKQKKIIQKEILAKNKACIVITDAVQKNLGNYFTGFSPDVACQFINYAEADTFHFPQKAKIMLLNNWYTRYLSGMDEQDLPYYANRPVNPVFADEKLNLAVYELDNFGNSQKLFSTLNDFESEKPYWNQPSNISNEQVDSGKWSEKTGEFSVNCSIPLDSFLNESVVQIVVLPKLRIFANKNSKCNLVISMESGGEQYFWKGFDLSKYDKSSGNWWTASVNEVIDKSAIRANSMMKVYIWNNEKNEIYIDNFGIDILSTKNK